ncbi:ComEC/Rec2 family competence protein [Planctomycetota bacterium]
MNWLEVHVFGSNVQGEGIVIKLPDGGFGVVDACFNGDIADPEGNPIVQMLRGSNVNNLSFVCLTHPHADHFYGLSHIIHEFNPGEFWIPAVMTPESLRQILVKEQIEAERIEDELNRQPKAKSKRRRYAEELSRVFQLARGIPSRRGNLRTELYPSPSQKSPDIRISALSPCAEEVSAYEVTLRHCFDENNLPRAKMPALKHNRISLGLLLECRSFSVVLSGDMEKNNWNAAVREFGAERLSAKLVKISHHGSKTGMTDESWDAFSSREKPTAVFTNFSRSSLPEADVINRIGQHASQIHATHRSFLDKWTEKPAALRGFFQSVPGDHQLKRLKRGFNDVSRIADSEYGVCSYYFDESGNCDIEAIGPACEVPSGRAAI